MLTATAATHASKTTTRSSAIAAIADRTACSSTISARTTTA